MNNSKIPYIHYAIINLLLFIRIHFFLFILFWLEVLVKGWVSCECNAWGIYLYMFMKVKHVETEYLQSFLSSEEKKNITGSFFNVEIRNLKLLLLEIHLVIKTLRSQKKKISIAHRIAYEKFPEHIASWAVIINTNCVNYCEVQPEIR